MARGGEIPNAASECWAMVETMVNGWLATAKPGERLIYAKGPRLLRTAGVEAISRAGDEQRVRLNFTRGIDGVGHYLATMLPPAMRADAPRTAAIPRPEEPERDEEQRVLAVLRRHANMGKPCPTNVEIARQAQLKNADRAAYLLRLLISAQHIRVEAATDGQRIITIVGSGKRTARVASGRG